MFFFLVFIDFIACIGISYFCVNLMNEAYSWHVTDADIHVEGIAVKTNWF